LLEILFGHEVIRLYGLWRSNEPRVMQRVVYCAVMNKLLSLLLVTALALPVVGQSLPAQESESEVRQTLSDFIQAFDNLDWERFRSAFADEATVFYPRAFPRRADGRAEFERTFQHVFEQIRAGRSKGPYMDLQPRDLRIQVAGDTAIVTFHLDDRPGFLNRRTIILRKTERGWKIIHLHASEMQTASSP
jgi:ketosteroid isomerase-like protein